MVNIFYLAGFVLIRLSGDGWGCVGVRARLRQALVLVVAGGLAGSPICWYVLYRNTMWGDVVDLAWRGNVDEIIGLNLNLISWWQESVKTHNEVWMALKELGHTVDDPRSVYAVETK